MKPTADAPVAPGFAVWLTGLPAAGKSTIAQALAKLLRGSGLPVIVLDSDEVRALLAVEGEYDSAGRRQFYSALSAIAAVAARQGVNVVIAATANRRAYRDHARALVPQFSEVFVNTPLGVCLERDPKGIYRKGLEGANDNVPGLQALYEEPLQPDVIVDGQSEPPDAAALRIAKRLVETGMAPSRILGPLRLRSGPP